MVFVQRPQGARKIHELGDLCALEGSWAGLQQSAPGLALMYVGGPPHADGGGQSFLECGYFHHPQDSLTSGHLPEEDGGEG